MVLLELATQGVRGFPNGVRLAFKPGYTLLKPPDSADQGGPASLLELCHALLFSDGRGEDASLAKRGEKGKAALTLQGLDGSVYRVVRELGGGGALHKLNPGGASPTTLTQSSSEITQYLRGEVGLPGPRSFRELFGLTAGQFPSHRPRASAGGTSEKAASPPQLLGQIPVTAASDVAAAQGHLVELQRELKLAHEIEALQFKLDGLASQQFELERSLSQTEKVRDAARAAEAAYRAAPNAKALGLPDNIEVRLERHPRMVVRRDEAAAKLEADRAEAEEEEARRQRPEPLDHDLRFWAGILVGTASLVGGVALQGVGRYVALFDLPAFGVSAALALKYLDELSESGRSKKHEHLFEKRAAKISEEFDAEDVPVKTALAALGVQSPSEAIDALRSKERLKRDRDAAQVAVSELEGSPEHRTRTSGLEAVKAEMERLNAQLLDKGGYVRDAREVERDLKRTRESIDLAQRAGTAGAAQVSPSPPLALESASGTGCEDPGPALLTLAADLWSCDLPAAAAELNTRCVQYLTALCDKRYTAVDFGPDGRTHLTGALGKVPGSALGPRDADLLYLAIKLAVLENACTKQKVPMLWDEGHGAVDEAKWPLVARMLKHLASLTQVAQVCGHPAFLSAAEVTLGL